MKNFTKLLGFGLGAVLLASSALPASASSLTTVQINAIIQLLQSFGADQNTIANVQSALGGSTGVPVDVPQCVDLSNTLALGSTGTDVFNLQHYLIARGYLTGTAPTGYFGSLTQQAVGKWQSAHGISAIGIVGPQTRGAMGCVATAVSPTQPTSSIATNGSASFASPTSGSVPLTVGFNENAGGARIDFGDGSSSSLAGYCSSNNCSITHTYMTVGTYTVQIQGSSGNILGTAVITVVNPSSVTATIDQSSLSNTLGYPIITGTFSGNSLNEISVEVYKGMQNPPQQLGRPGDSGEIGGGPISGSTFANGHYSIVLSAGGNLGFQPGIYTVGVYSAAHLLTSGTLTVGSTPYPPPAP